VPLKTLGSPVDSIRDAVYSAVCRPLHAGIRASQTAHTMEQERVTEQAVAIQVLKRVLAMRDAGPEMDEGTLAEYVAGYEVALQELAEWLTDAYAILQAEVDAWEGP